MGENKTVEKYNKEKTKLLDKYKLLERPLMNFPLYREYPEDLKLALVVIQNHKPVFTIGLVSTEENLEKETKNDNKK